MIEKVASPWVTLPTIVLSIVTAVTQCQEKHMVLEEKLIVAEELGHDARLMQWMAEQLTTCRGGE